MESACHKQIATMKDLIKISASMTLSVKMGCAVSDSSANPLTNVEAILRSTKLVPKIHNAKVVNVMMIHYVRAAIWKVDLGQSVHKRSKTTLQLCAKLVVAIKVSAFLSSSVHSLKCLKLVANALKKVPIVCQLIASNMIAQQTYVYRMQKVGEVLTKEPAHYRQNVTRIELVKRDVAMRSNALCKRSAEV